MQSQCILHRLSRFHHALATIVLWTATCVVGAQEKVDVAAPTEPRPLALRPLDDSFARDSRSIDTIIGDRAAANQPLVDDRTFIRRASLDLVGLMPATEAVEKFAADSSVDKRAKLVDELLSDLEIITDKYEKNV